MYASDVTKTRYGSFWFNRTFISVINIRRQGRGLELDGVDERVLRIMLLKILKEVSSLS